jgi:two-component system response regulator RegA
MMKHLLLVDDDITFCTVLGDSLRKRGFEVAAAHNVAGAAQLARTLTPEYAVIDLKMPGDSGLVLIPQLLAIDPYTRIVVLTGYASITTAVEAIKLGAIHYLAKPVGSDEIIAAFDKHAGDPAVAIEPGDDAAPLPLMQHNWQHITATLERNEGNISATARQLNMHRRTLQRKLDKMPQGRI